MVRVRFAPSPTGNLHVGNGRTAVLNYLFARRNKGSFILRIEDTDLERSETLFEDAIGRDLGWLELPADEGPYRQSERLDVYRDYARLLLGKGFAYKCFCSKEELERARGRAKRLKTPPRYSRTCRDLAVEEAKKLEAQGRPFALRFKSLERKIAFRDAIRGEMEFPADHVDDFIIVRTDGVASYNFAAAVDDLLMDVTHVIRGSDHLSNTPKQIMLFLAFGKMPPVYAHHSLLTGSDRKPLSKRHGAATVAEFRAMGILPEAMMNYLAVVGRKTDREFMDRNALIETFSLESLSSSDVLFDLDKLLWLNKEHMRATDPGLIAEMLGLPATDREKVVLLMENARTLREMRSMLAIFGSADVEEEAASLLLSLKDLSQVRALLQAIAVHDHDDVERLFRELEEGSSLSKKEILMLLRIAITGRKSGPPLRDLYRLVPRESILKRIAWLEKRFSTPLNA
jgi:glutamyl-tRNA synthetase